MESKQKFWIAVAVVFFFVMLFSASKVYKASNESEPNKKWLPLGATIASFFGLCIGLYMGLKKPATANVTPLGVGNVHTPQNNSNGLQKVNGYPVSRT
jgi:hypothetical protein